MRVETLPGIPLALHAGLLSRRAFGTWLIGTSIDLWKAIPENYPFRGY